MKENVFEQMAARYDTKERIALAKVIQTQLEPNLKKDQILLDYGAGTGLVSLPFAKQVDQLVLMDAAKAMVEVAQMKIDQAGITNVQAVTGDLLAEEFEVKDLLVQPTVVLLSLVLLHIPDTQAILEQIYQLLPAGGELWLVDFDQNKNVNHPKVHSGFDQLKLADLLHKIGFKNSESKTFYAGKELFMKQDASLFFLQAVK